MKNLVVQVNINGAVVFPTVEQEKQIRVAVSKIVFGVNDEVVALGNETTPRVKRAYHRKSRRRAWNEDEKQMLIRLNGEGQSAPDIAKELNLHFNNHRTGHSVYLKTRYMLVNGQLQEKTNQ